MTNANSFTRRINAVVVCFLVLCFYYYSYRYIFQYNSESTSPTYSETPELFKLFKYILLAGLSIVLIYIKWRCKKQYIAKRSKNLLFLIIIWSLLLALNGIIFNELETIKIVLVYFFPIILIVNGCFDVDMKRISSFFIFFFYYSVVYELVQVLLFLLVGRLPALAYENSFSVRFGGPWDDPNGFGIFLSFFFPFFFFHFKSVRIRFLSLFVCLIMLLLTQSGTAVIAVGASSSMFFILYKRERKHKKILKISFVFVSILITYYFMSQTSFWEAFIEQKSGSIEGHKESYEYLRKMDGFEFVFGLSNFGGESSVIELISRWGVFYYLLFLNIMFRNLYILFKFVRITKSPFWMGAFNYQLCYVIAMTNIPVLRAFYLSLFSSIILGLSEVFYSYNVRSALPCRRKF